MEKFSKHVKQAQESLGPGRLRPGLRVSMSQFQCLSCSLSSSSLYCSGCYSSTRASSYISVLLPQVSAHLHDPSAAPQGGEERVGDLPGLLASSAVSSRASGPGHQEHFDVGTFIATWTKNPAELLAQKGGLTHREELMFFRETGGNMKTHKNQWVHSSIAVRLCLLNPLPCHGQSQPNTFFPKGRCVHLDLPLFQQFHMEPSLLCQVCQGQLFKLLIVCSAPSSG